MIEKNLKIKITEPITSPDYRRALKLVEENLFKYDLTLLELKKSCLGELLVAKEGDHIIGMLRMWRPGAVFKEHDEKYFYFEKHNCDRRDTGYIALVVVDKDFQGKGVGKKLILSALKIQKNWGAKAVVVHASKNSPGNASEKLFNSLGFESIGLHKAPWLEYSKERGPEGFQCIFCGNPCKCDQLEMIKKI